MPELPRSGFVHIGKYHWSENFQIRSIDPYKRPGKGIKIAAREREETIVISSLCSLQKKISYVFQKTKTTLGKNKP